MIPIFDHHIHMDVRDCNGYETMALSGVERILIPCSTTMEQKGARRSWADRFDRLTDFEVMRARAFGIGVCVALAVCASDAADMTGALEGLDELTTRLLHPNVAAIGEISLRTFSALEIELFQLHLRLATERDMPAIIEAPINLKDFERMLEELERLIGSGQADPNRICLIDVNYEKLQLAHHLGLAAYGVPVSPKVDGLFCIREKLDHHEVLRILDTFGPEGLMLNSGLHVGYADPLGLPKTVMRLHLHGLDMKTLSALAMENANVFFQPQYV